MSNPRPHIDTCAAPRHLTAIPTPIPAPMTAEELDAFDAFMGSFMLPSANGPRLLAEAKRQIARRHLSVVE